MSATSLTISIVGCGWLGLPLLRALVAAGHRVRGTSRNPDTLAEIRAAGGEAFFLDLPGAIPAALLADADVLIITLPPGGRRSGPETTTNYLAALQGFAPWLRREPSLRVIFTSSTGVYGNSTGLTDETAPLRPDTHSARAMLAGEDFLASFQNPPTILRLAGLVGPGRHPGRFYGGRERAIPQADAPVNVVHLNDVLSAMQLVLRLDSRGAYNVCAAAHPPKGEFYAAAAAGLGLEIAGTLPGGSGGKRISSEKLRALGWQPEWDDLNISFLKE